MLACPDACKSTSVTHDEAFSFSHNAEVCYVALSWQALHSYIRVFINNPLNPKPSVACSVSQDLFVAPAASGGCWLQGSGAISPSWSMYLRVPKITYLDIIK